MVGLNASLEGLNRALGDFDRAAAKIAQPQTADPQSQQGSADQLSLSDQMVNLMQARNYYDANLKALQVANQMEKKLLDIVA